MFIGDDAGPRPLLVPLGAGGAHGTGAQMRKRSDPRIVIDQRADVDDRTAPDVRRTFDNRSGTDEHGLIEPASGAMHARGCTTTGRRQPRLA